MNEEEKTIVRLRAIDTERLDDAEDNPEAIEFNVLFSSAPSEPWKQEFEQAYRQTPYTLKPPIEVVEDRLKITFLPRYASELEGYFQFLALIVARANDELRRTADIQASHTQEQRRAEFRRALQRVKLPG